MLILLLMPLSPFKRLMSIRRFIEALKEQHLPSSRWNACRQFAQPGRGTAGFNPCSNPAAVPGQPGQTARQALVDTSAGVIGATSEEDLVVNADARRVQGIGQFATETGVATLLTAGLGTLGGPARQMLPGWMQAGLARVPLKRTLVGLLLPGKKPLLACRTR